MSNPVSSLVALAQILQTIGQLVAMAEQIKEITGGEMRDLTTEEMQQLGLGNAESFDALTALMVARGLSTE